MDALAGYGSSSDSSDNAGGDDKPKSALSGLLGNLSDASDDDDDVLHEKLDEEESHAPPKKKIRQEEDAGEKSQQHQVLPQPQLLATDDANTITSDPFQSLILSTKDYTTQLRQTLSQQIQSQTNEISDKQKRLADKLKLLQNTFQNKPSQLNDTRQPNSLDSNASSSTSFASHLKSKHEFGNPHLLKDIIDHFQINSYDSKQQFKPFEYYDRLQISEEKAIIAAANYDAGSTL
jgi:hypothetical protein